MGAKSVSNIGDLPPPPTAGREDRSGIQPEGQWPLGVAVEAGPLPGFGATDQAGMERVALDISQDHQQMVIILDRKSGTVQ